MSIEALIQKARERGVKLSLVGGQIKFEGGREAVKALLEPLRQHKAELTRWLQSANGKVSSEQHSEGSQVHLGPDNWNSPVGTTAKTISCQSAPQRLFRQRVPLLTFRKSSAAREYHSHHFKCPTCIAAGRGSRYGQRCGAGIALWRAYSG